jgi:1-acyl-sn-glycerol-3-phosphate acyltransferase
MDKIINSRCRCGQILSHNGNEVVLCLPCEHMTHIKCLNKRQCGLCNKFVKSIVRMNDYKKDKSKLQYCIDIISMTNFNNSRINYLNIFSNIPDVLGIFINLFLLNNIDHSLSMCQNIFHLNNMNITVHNLNIIKNEPKIFIANHTTQIDGLIMFYIFKCGFLTIEAIKNNFIINQITKLIPLLFVKRGKSNNSIEKIKKYVQKNGSLCLFPEGMLTHPQTLIKFRTGAFYTDLPIYPVIIKYKNKLFELDDTQFVLKLLSNQKIDIDVIVLEPFYPPFDNYKIELVRKSMAKAGNLLLSRVSNRDIKD